MTVLYDEIMVRYGELSTKGKIVVTLSIVWQKISAKSLQICLN